MIVAGIDYSMNSPGITVHQGLEWNAKNCKFHYIVPKEKMLFTTSQFSGTLYKPYVNSMERFGNLTDWTLEILKEANVEKVFIEGAAFGATGSRMSQMGENTGILKYHIWKQDLPLEIYPPTMIKKFATTRGNANKQTMYEAFIAETGIDIRTILNTIKENPVSDIIDSYYIAKLGFSNL